MPLGSGRPSLRRAVRGAGEPPMERVSMEVKPDMDPEPYLMLKGSPARLYVLDLAEAYRRCRRHAS